MKVTEIRKITAEDLDQFAQNHNWIWAKTFAKHAPHWYIVGSKENAEFMAMCDFINQQGIATLFWRSQYIVLSIWEYKYWVMDAYKNTEKIINRTLTDPEQLAKITTSLS